jgi:hypothetical protein
LIFIDLSFCRDYDNDAPCNARATALAGAVVVSRFHDERGHGIYSKTTALGFKRALVPLDGSMVAEAILPHRRGAGRDASNRIFYRQILHALEEAIQHGPRPLSS